MEAYFLLLDSSSDEDNENVVRRKLRDESNPLDLPEKKFIKRYRLSKEAFLYILIEVDISGKRCSSIPAIPKLASTLSLLGGGAYQYQVGNDYLIGMAQSTISTIVNEVLEELESKLCAKWIKFSLLEECKIWFLQKYNIPGVLSANCREVHTQDTDECPSASFKCLSGECIARDDSCDGEKDCEDGTDEIAEMCGAQKCPENSFRCSYGACVPIHKRCNGILNCADGSDETTLLCGASPPRLYQNIFYKTCECVCKLNRVSDDQCEVGNWPNTIVSYAADSNDRLQAGGFVDDFTDIHIDCLQGLTRYGSQLNTCLHGRWAIQPIPTCERTCEPIHNGVSFEAKCTYKRESVECTDPARPQTEVVYTCKIGYSLSESYETAVCRQNGEWDYNLSPCLPVCGVVPIQQPTFISGRTISNIYVPWSVAIYKVGTYTLICGGTIVTTRVVISAAHCFWNFERDEMADKSDYLVVAGKYYPDIDANEQLPIQRFKLEEIIIFENYHDRHGNFEADIAVLVLERDIIYQYHIKPICIDIIGAEHVVEVGTLGRMAGFGVIDSENTPTNELRVAELQVENRSNCIVKLGKLFKYTITGDKICVKGHVSDAVCMGDAGGGFTVARDENNSRKHYLYGVVSHAASDNQCNENSYVAITNIQAYMSSLRDYILKSRVV